ncbi:MAG TPA: hypothetical protein VMT16_13190 [Thermoanaerobaculia bacterium]|nr:hypothetical protein [Thermoanaerobaculia bacterium]
MPDIPSGPPRSTPPARGSSDATPAAGSSAGPAATPAAAEKPGPIGAAVGEQFEKAAQALGAFTGLLGLPGSQQLGELAAKATRVADAVLRQAQPDPLVQQARELKDWAAKQAEDPYARDSDYSQYRKPAHESVQKQAYHYKRGDWKCNVFIGDVLSQAGFEPALSSKGRYSQAESLPRKDAFTPITDLRDLRPGDVLVLDYPGSGGATAHVEIVTGVARDEQGKLTQVTSIGGRGEGVVENDDKGALLVAGQDSPRSSGFQNGTTTLYVIRPNQGGGTTAPLQEGAW